MSKIERTIFGLLKYEESKTPWNPNIVKILSRKWRYYYKNRIHTNGGIYLRLARNFHLNFERNRLLYVGFLSMWKSQHQFYSY